MQGIGVAAGEVVSEQTAEGVRSVMGGGLLGGLALVDHRHGVHRFGVMNDYSGSLALQTLGVRVRRPFSSVVVTVLAFGLILWLHAADTAARFQNVLLLVSYWVPAFVAIVAVDWWFRAAVATPSTRRWSSRPVGCRRGADDVRGGLRGGRPVHEHHRFHGPVAAAWHGADVAYFVDFLVAAVLYGGYRLARRRR